MRLMLSSIFHSVADWFFPPKCPFCKTVGDTDAICPTCQRDLPWESQPRRTLGKAGTLPCAAPLAYDGLVRKAMHRFKFEGCRYLSKPMGQLMAQTAAEAYPDGFDIITWAPVSKKRLAKRGYDQGYLLAKSMCAIWDATPQRLLLKHTHTVAQSTLHDEAARRGNVIGVYEAVAGISIVGKRILLVDDVATTGSTLIECARVLEVAGAKEVMCITLAKTHKKSSL